MWENCDRGQYNGKIGAFPQNMLFDFFRGENDDYDTKYPCVPSIYRSTRIKSTGFFYGCKDIPAG